MIGRYTIRILLVVSCIGFSANAIAQKLTYKILMNNKVIGTLTGDRQVEKESEKYLMQSNMLIHKVIDVKIDYKIESSFSNGKLIKSSVVQHTNRKANTNTKTQWDGYQYTVQLKNDNVVIKNKTINYNMSSIYYNEPIGLSEVYSDAFGKFLNIRSVGTHRYELTLPDGKKTFYNYASGICFQVESEVLFYKIIFRLTH